MKSVLMRPPAVYCVALFLLLTRLAAQPPLVENAPSEFSAADSGRSNESSTTNLSGPEQSAAPGATALDDTRPSLQPVSGSDSAFATPVLPSVAAASSSEKFSLKGALLQSLQFTVFDHLWRAAFDPSLRYQLAHKPFYHDWFASYGGYNLHRWGDGDDFVVNYVGHPLQGAVYGRIFMQNEPRSRVRISSNRDYWMTRLKSTAWSAAWEVLWKVGPLSETSLGNAGGWEYVPGCGTDPSCLNNPKYPTPPTNNTGLTDWVATPLLGLVWIIGEDTIDRYVVAPVARQHPILGGRVLRALLEPSKDFAALFAGQLVWQLPREENNFVSTAKTHHATVIGENSKDPDPIDHWEIGGGYTNVSLPVLTADCKNCRQNISGTGMNLTYNITRAFSLDGDVNLLPGQGGAKGMAEGLFGLKMGAHTQHVGVFAKARPGFIYYQEAYPGGGVTTPTNLTRFAADFGGVVEVYPSRHSSLRFDVGTTLVRYLTDHPDPRLSPIGNLLSEQYIVTQGNFQVSARYLFRF